MKKAVLPILSPFNLFFWFSFLLCLSSSWLQAQFEVPEDITFREADVMSEGTRIAAEVFTPKEPAEGKLPTIVMSHGWGGTAKGLRPDAVAFAQAGFLVVTIDYRGWGNSDSRLILAGEKPKEVDGKLVAEVKEVREVVDPIDQTTDILNAIHWLQGEKRCLEAFDFLFVDTGDLEISRSLLGHRLQDERIRKRIGHRHHAICADGYEGQASVLREGVSFDFEPAESTVGTTIKPTEPAQVRAVRTGDGGGFASGLLVPEDGHAGVDGSCFGGAARIEKTNLASDERLALIWCADDGWRGKEW